MTKSQKRNGGKRDIYENCVVREIKDFNKLSESLFLLVSSMKDENAKNYKMKKCK